jgi:hypothetical protein
MIEAEGQIFVICFHFARTDRVSPYPISLQISYLRPG